MGRLKIGLILLAAALALGYPHTLLWKPAGLLPGVTTVRVYLHQEDKVQTMLLEDYLVGVVAAEMPATFPPEALKAQAVAARTYTLRRLGEGKVDNPQHPGADVCDDHRHCQAWMSRDELKQRWGLLHYYNHYYKISQAVEETRGEVITHQGRLIDPVYHASCGGKTENSEDVWKFQIPYLRSVPCPYNGDPRLLQTASFSLAQIDLALGTSLAVVPAAGQGQRRPPALKVLDKTATGRPKTVQFGNKQFSAMTVREQLGLRSTNFTWQLEGDSVTFTTSGHGHGVGLCQYGAKGMAEYGYDYRTILGHYYTGTDLDQFNSSSGQQAK